MIALHGGNNLLILIITESQIEQMREGKLCTVFNHSSRVVKDIVLITAVDSDDAIKKIEAIGTDVSDSWRRLILSGMRNDRVAGS